MKHGTGNGNGSSNGYVHLLSCYSGKTVLGVGAHPDDLEIGIGGTLASLSEAGARVVMAVVSIPSQLETRREEAERAAEILGGKIRLLIPDRASRVEDLRNYQLVGMIDSLIREFSPVAVFTHSRFNLHLDHKLVYEACLASQRLGYFDFFCYSPTTSREMNIPFAPQAFVDISSKIDTKMTAINTHDSQFGHRGLSTDHFREHDRLNGQIIGVDYAEGLEIVRLRLNLGKANGLSHSLLGRTAFWREREEGHTNTADRPAWSGCEFERSDGVLELGEA